ncbi:hypothetical protein [Alistipes sp.]|uniref:hypothetical protein n=1 Tax=Alistipes sp. TaxID=1872444 RepID=UPI003AF0F803
MKNLILALLVFAFISCDQKYQEIVKVDDGNCKEITFKNFNNTGVDFRLESYASTRTGGVIVEYPFEATMPDGFVMKGIIRVETFTTGDRLVSLYRLDDYVADEIFIGSYVVNPMRMLSRVDVGQEPANPDSPWVIIGTVDPGVIDIDKLLRQRGETYWACVRREWREMRDAYKDRPLDAIACDLIDPACQALALVAAAYECGK